MNAHSGWVLLNGHPGWLAALALLALASVASGLSSARGLPRRRKGLLLALRVLTLVLAALAVLRPAREVELVRPRTQPLAVLVDLSRSMLLGPEPAGPRVAPSLRSLLRGLGELPGFYRTEFLTLGDPPPAFRPESLEGAQAFSAASTPLGRTLETLARTRPDLAGIVLFSDGRDTENPGRPPTRLGVPVYPLLLETGEPKDLRIEAVETPPVAFIRTPVEVRVKLGLSGLPSGSASVVLLEQGRPLVSRTVTVGAGGTTASLTFTPTRTGRKAYRVEVAPWPGDAAPANNRAQFTLNVIRDKTRVLFVSGTPTWDVKLLRRRLTRDPGVDLISFMILRTPEDVSAVPQDELSLIPFPTDELFSKELHSFDAVVFANFDYAPYVPSRYLGNLVKFVKENGGGFAMLGGDRSFSLGGYLGTSLEEILPLELGGAAAGQEYLDASFRPRLTAAGLNHPLFQWRPSAAENRQLWASLPSLAGLNWTLKAGPGAVVLAENPEARNEYGPLPLVALGEYGAGRTLAITTDSLWHWAMGAEGPGDETVYRDFWTRALRWLAHDPEMELVRLGLPPEPLRAGEPLRFRARVLDRAYRPLSRAALSGFVTGGRGLKVPLRWEESAPGEYASQPVRIPAEGLWSVEVEAKAAGGLLGRDRAEIAVAPDSPEALRVGLDRAYLEALATGSRGRPSATPDALVEVLRERGRARMEVVGRRVDEAWPRAWLLIAAVLLFGLDWTLRRLWE